MIIFIVLQKIYNNQIKYLKVMKKAILLVLAIAMTLYAGAQKKMINAAQDALEKGELDKAWGSIQTALTNDETKDLPKTWLVKGKILQAIGKADTLKKYSSISENPAVEAFASYQKAIELDAKKKVNKEIDLQLLELSSIAANKAILAFDAKNYDRALELFELILTIEANPMYNNKVDTAMVFNCGLASLNAKKYDKAIDYFKKAATYKYGGGNTYSLIKNAYMSKGDTVNALATMKMAFEAYPNELTVIVDLINFYLLNNQAEQAMSYLNKAKQKEPNNVSFLFAEGTLREKMNQPDSAFEVYLKATKIDSNYFNAYYNIGVMFYNKAVKVFDAASLEKDDAKYQELQKKGDEELKKALPYMEKAHKIDPKEKVAAETLKGLYYRLQMNEKLKALKQEMGW
jgi:tetratricopeptide (TPR) repeat protein